MTDPTDRLVRLLGSVDEPPLDECLLLVSAALAHPDAVANGRSELDSLAAGIDEPTIPHLVEHLYVANGFGGDVDDYHAAANSYLDQVLIRRRGMPITLAAVLICVGAQVGLTLHGVGMPGHFLVGIPPDSTGNRGFIDPFSGVVLDETGAADRFRGVFGTDIEFDTRVLSPVGAGSIVGRVLNNLVRTYAERDPSKLDALLDLRVHLPGPPAERRLLVRIAESRARWDVAATIREELDPEDPEVLGLRSRLN